MPHIVYELSAYLTTDFDAFALIICHTFFSESIFFRNFANCGRRRSSAYFIVNKKDTANIGITDYGKRDKI